MEEAPIYDESTDSIVIVTETSISVADLTNRLVIAQNNKAIAQVEIDYCESLLGIVPE